MRTLVYGFLVEFRRDGTAIFACKKRGLYEAITPAFLQDLAASGRGVLRNMYSRQPKEPRLERSRRASALPSLEGARHNYRTGRAATRASASASTLSSGLEHLRESLAVVRMDCEDPKAHVVTSRSTRGELFDPDDLRRTRNARLILQEDFNFQPRTHLHLLIRVDAQTAQTRINPPASDEKAQDGPREIYRCPNARVRKALGHRYISRGPMPERAGTQSARSRCSPSRCLLPPTATVHGPDGPVNSSSRKVPHRELETEARALAWPRSAVRLTR